MTKYYDDCGWLGFGIGTNEAKNVGKCDGSTKKEDGKCKVDLLSLSTEFNGLLRNSKWDGSEKKTVITPATAYRKAAFYTYEKDLKYDWSNADMDIHERLCVSGESVDRECVHEELVKTMQLTEQSLWCMTHLDESSPGPDISCDPLREQYEDFITTSETCETVEDSSCYSSFSSYIANLR